MIHRCTSDLSKVSVPSFSLDLTLNFYLAIEKEMDSVYYPIAAAPYFLFLNEKRPIKKLLE